MNIISHLIIAYSSSFYCVGWFLFSYSIYFYVCRHVYHSLFKGTKTHTKNRKPILLDFLPKNWYICTKHIICNINMCLFRAKYLSFHSFSFYLDNNLGWLCFDKTFFFVFVNFTSKKIWNAYAAQYPNKNRSFFFLFRFLYSKQTSV